MRLITVVNSVSVNQCQAFILNFLQSTLCNDVVCVVCFFRLAIRPDWFGMLYSQADSKKKSNLMMSLFDLGSEPLPWLGRMAQLGPTSGREIPLGYQYLTAL